MTRIRPLLAAFVFAVAAMVFAVGAPAAGAATSVCSSGDGCIHQNASADSAVSWHRADYGTHPIYGWNGTHWVENAQTGGALMELLDKNKNVRVTLWDGQSGRNPRAQAVDMKPIYYIKLAPAPSCWPRCS